MIGSTRYLAQVVRTDDIAPGATYTQMGGGWRPDEALREKTRSMAKLLSRISRDMYADGQQGFAAHPLVVHHALVIENYVTEILASAAPGFECHFDASGQIVKLTEQPLGRFYSDRRIRMGPVVDKDLELTLDSYNVRPKVQLYLDVYARHPVGRNGSQYFSEHPAYRTPAKKKEGEKKEAEREKYRWQSYNDLIDSVRSEAKARDIARLDAQNDYAAKRRFKEMSAYARRRCESKQRVFVTHLDLYYQPEYGATVDLELVKEHHALFANRLRALKLIQDSVLGGIWKLEWSAAKGHYVRWIFLFDGDLVQAAWECAELIGEQWEMAVPRSAGCATVGNDNEEFSAGIGLIDMADSPGKWQLFEETVLHYLAVKDQIFSIKRPDGTRAWGTFTP